MGTDSAEKGDRTKDEVGELMVGTDSSEEANEQQAKVFKGGS